MSATDWQRIKEVLGAALEREPAERSGFVAKACRGEEAVRARVEALLASEGAAEAAFSSLPGVAGAPEATDAPQPARVGNYAVRRLIAAGGMGVVYEGEQENPHRRVALKVGAGVMTRSGIARFRQEGEILGRLQHPGIAQIYEAGVEDAASGHRPFFAMELVDGRPLTLYAQGKAVRQRLALMADVCDAVHHAHIKGVIHRDLKPDNILVDGQGRIKVVDFGVARLADAEGLTLRTQAGEMVGTVPYMSPEQLSGDPRDVDARSDVYALGVVLYEVLSGRRPHQMEGRSLPGAVRAACEEEAPALGSVCPACRGDLEVIAGRALEREPERRYQSAAELGADLRRYLADEPVLARPPTVWYQLRKLARRNRALTAGIVAGAACLMLGIAVAGWGVVRALDQAARAREISGFLADMIGSTDPYYTGKRLTPVEMLDTAASKIPARFPNRPIVRAELHDTIGRAFFSNGDSGKAEEQLRLARDLRLAHLGPDDPKTLDSADMLGFILRLRGWIRESETILRATLETRERVLGPGHLDTLESVMHLADLLLVLRLEGEDFVTERRVLARRAAVGLAALLDPRHPRVLEAWGEWALALGDRDDDWAEALAMARDTVETSRVAYTERHPITLMARHDVIRLMVLHHDKEAPALAEQLVADYKAELGLESLPAIRAVYSLANLRLDQGRLRDAEDLLREIEDVRPRVVGDRNRTALTAHWYVATLLHRRGEYHEAERYFREAWDGFSDPRAIRPDTYLTLWTQCQILRSLADMGPDTCVEVERLALDAYRLGQHTYPKRHATLRAAGALAVAQRWLGCAAEGECTIRAALAAMPPPPELTQRTNYREERALGQAALGGCLLDVGRLDDAESELLSAYSELSIVRSDAWLDGVRRVVIDLADLSERRQDGCLTAFWRDRLAALDRGE